MRLTKIDEQNTNTMGYRSYVFLTIPYATLHSIGMERHVKARHLIRTRALLAVSVAESIPTSTSLLVFGFLQKVRPKTPLNDRSGPAVDCHGAVWARVSSYFHIVGL